MPYIANTLIAMPTFCCHQDAVVVNCPPKLLQQLITDKMIRLVGEPDTVMDDLQDLFMDDLSDMNKDQLIGVLKANKHLLKLFTPTTTWTDEQIRQAIRNSVGNDLSSLVIPGKAESDVPVPLIGTESDDAN